MLGLTGLTKTHDEISTSTDIPGYAPGMMRMDGCRALGVLGRVEVGVTVADGLGELAPLAGLLVLFCFCLGGTFFSDRGNGFEGMVGRA
jgi:hypothetical protein